MRLALFLGMRRSGRVNSVRRQGGGRDGRVAGPDIRRGGGCGRETQRENQDDRQPQEPQ